MEDGGTISDSDDELQFTVSDDLMAHSEWDEVRDILVDQFVTRDLGSEPVSTDEGRVCQYQISYMSYSYHF